MHRALPSFIVALVLTGIAPARAAEPAAEAAGAPESSMDTAMFRRESLADIHGELQRTDRLAAECERRGFPEGKALRRELEQARLKHAEGLTAARAAYQDAASADKRHTIEEEHAAIFARLKSRQALRAACRSAAEETADLDGLLRYAFVLLEVEKPEPAPDADPTQALSREQLLTLLHVNYVDLELMTAECERRGLSDARILRRTLDALRQGHAKEWAEAEDLFKRGAGFMPYEQGLKHMRDHEQTLRQQSAQEIRQLCRGFAERAESGGDLTKAFGFDTILAAIAAKRAAPAQP